MKARKLLETANIGDEVIFTKWSETGIVKKEIDLIFAANYYDERHIINGKGILITSGSCEGEIADGYLDDEAIIKKKAEQPVIVNGIAYI